MHRKKISEKRCIRQNLTKRKLVQLLFPQVYLFLAVLGPQSGAWAFSGCRAQALGPVDSVIAVCRLSSCAACVGSRARRLSYLRFRLLPGFPSILSRVPCPHGPKWNPSCHTKLQAA